MAKLNWTKSAAFEIKTRGYAGGRPASEWHIAYALAEKISGANGCEDKEYMVIFDPHSIIAKLEKLDKYSTAVVGHRVYMAIFKGGEIVDADPSNEVVKAFLVDCDNETAKGDDAKPAKANTQKLVKSNGISAKDVQKMIANNNKDLVAEFVKAMKD
jgi:hypothetical protein